MEKINNRCHKCFWFIIFLFIVLLFCFNSNALMDNIFLMRNEYLKSDLQPRNQRLQEDSNLQPQNKQQPENSNLQPQNNQQPENSNLQPKNKQQAENSNLQPREQQQLVNSILQPQHQQQPEDSILQPHKRRQPLIKEEHKVRPAFSRTGWFATNQFALEVIFYYRMKQYECLTTNSSLASAIYVPFFAGLDVSHYLWGGFNTTVRDFHSLELVKWVANKPEWRAFGGRDHFLVGGRITWDFRRPRETDSEWGNKLLALPQVKNMTVLEIESSPWSSYDIGVPYPTYFHPSKDREVSQWQRRMRGQKRRWLFSFAGAPHPGSLDSIRGEIINQCLASKRSKLLECSQCGNKCHSPSSIMKMFRRSVFCLQPQGDSYT